MKFKRLTAMAASFVLILSATTGAVALDKEISIVEVDSNNIVMFEEVIGTLADQDGILLSGETATRTVGTLFSMTATSVSNLLTTYDVNGKSFTGGAMDGLTGEGLKITGTVTSSLGTGGNYTVKVGACYYQPSNDSFVSVVNSQFTSGTQDTMWRQKMNFSNSMTYYGHITNSLGYGTVSGTLTFSVATQT